jgi:hypothetical protein
MKALDRSLNSILERLIRVSSRTLSPNFAILSSSGEIRVGSRKRSCGGGVTFDPDRPFNDLPLLPPKAELETKRVLKAAIGARRRSRS